MQLIIFYSLFYGVLEKCFDMSFQVKQLRHFFKRLLIALGLCWVTTIAFAATEKPLPADQAFVVKAIFNHPQQLTVTLTMAPNYYLYAHYLRMTFSPKIEADIRLPRGQFKKDTTGVEYEAYQGTISIPIMLTHPPQTFQLNIFYQGCSQAGFCYPPMHKAFTVDIEQQTIDPVLSKPDSTFSFQSLLTNQSGVQAALQKQSLGVILAIFFGLGLLLAFTPCVLPMIPILTSIIVGTHAASHATRKAFWLSLTYVMGSALMYAIAGMIAAAIGSSLQVWLQKPSVIITVGLLFVLLAFSLFDWYQLHLPRWLHHRLHDISQKQRGGTYIGVFLMGMLSTLIISPCVTAPLVGILIYIGQTGNVVVGASALFTMGIGMGIPLLMIGTTAGQWLPKSGLWLIAIKKMFGLIMLGMAAWLISRVISSTLTYVVWGFFLISVALFFVLSLPQLLGRHQFNRSLGLLIGLIGIMLVFGGPYLPAKISWEAPTSFTVVHSLSALNRQLLIAKSQQKPVLLDFYADWCESCVTMDKEVFTRSNVRQALMPYVLLRVDLSENTAADEALLKQFDVIAPPTILFFDRDGQEITTQRIVGEVSETEFLTRLHCDKGVTC